MPNVWLLNQVCYIQTASDFLSIYDVIKVHQVSGYPNYDDAMTEGVSSPWRAKTVGRHIRSDPWWLFLLLHKQDLSISGPGLVICFNDPV